LPERVLKSLALSLTTFLLLPVKLKTCFVTCALYAGEVVKFFFCSFTVCASVKSKLDFPNFKAVP